MTKFQASSNKSSSINFPTIRPSLDLDFANSKTLDPRITFTRSSSGSYIGPDGLIKYAGVNQPRFDHDPVTGESLGLLIEESRFNSWLYSGQNVTTGWNTNGVNLSFDNKITAPDGTINTIKCTETNTYTPGKEFFQNFSVTSGNSYTFSIFAKQPDNSPLRYFSILFWNTGFSTLQIVTFDPKNGTVLFNNSGITTFIKKYPNGWWRFGITSTATSTGAIPFIIRITNSLTTSSNPPYVLGGPFGCYIGDGFSFLYFYGPQLEQGAFPTSYIPTQSSTRTRSEDIASIIGTNFSSWYNQTEGTFYSTIKSTTGIGGYIISARSLSSAGNRHQLVQTGGTTVVSNVITANFPKIYKSQNKQAYTYSTNNFSFVSDKDTIAQKFSGSIPTNISYATIGRADFGGIGTLNGTLSRLTYYPKRLPNSQLQTLTK
jgi:hypothetical protein